MYQFGLANVVFDLVGLNPADKMPVLIGEYLLLGFEQIGAILGKVGYSGSYGSGDFSNAYGFADRYHQHLFGVTTAARTGFCYCQLNILIVFFNSL
jgi:hypothetical protein